MRFINSLTGTATSLVPLLMQAAPILPDQTAAWLGVAAAAPFSICAQLSINKALVRNPAPKVSVIRKAIPSKARQGSFPNFLIAPGA